MDPTAFKELIHEEFAKVAGDLSTEAFANDLEAALQFCRAVRKRVGKQLPNEMLMRRLHNIRKATSRAG